MKIRIKREVDPTDLHTIQYLTMGWMLKNLNYFAIDHDISKNFRWELKSFIELVFLINYLKRSNLWSYDERLEEIGTFIELQLVNSHLEDVVHLDPDGVSGLAILEEFIRFNGLENVSFRPVLNKFSRFEQFDLLQKIPFRLMDLKYSLDRAEINNELPSYVDLYQETVAGKKAAVGYMSTTDIYSVTHVIFYLTDMGNRKVEEFLPKEEKNFLQQLVIKLLGISICQNNLDTMGELLMCCIFLDISPMVLRTDLLFQTSWNLIHHFQRKDGSVSSITFKESKYLASTSKKEYTFINNYHTTLVILGATTAWLSKENDE